MYEILVYLFENCQQAELAYDRERVAKKGKWQHVFVTYDGSGKPEGVKIFVDGTGTGTETENAKGITGSANIGVGF